MNEVCIRLYGPEVTRLTEGQPDTISRSHWGRLAVWVGLTLVEAQPKWVDQGFREMQQARQPGGASKVSFGIRLYGAEAMRLLAVLDDHPALTKNSLGRLAGWLGAMVISEQPEWVNEGLREMRDAKEALRVARRASQRRSSKKKRGTR